MFISCLKFTVFDFTKFSKTSEKCEFEILSHHAHVIKQNLMIKRHEAVHNKIYGNL